MSEHASLVAARRAKARAAGLCARCCTQQPAPGFAICPRCLATQRKANGKRAAKRAAARAVRQAERAAKIAAARPRVRVVSAIRGETLPQRLLREAVEYVRAAISGRRGKPGVPTTAGYGTIQHGARRRYDAAVHAEFHRRLKAAGVEVES